MQEQYAELTGVIDRVIFKSQENGFSVIALKVGKSESVVVKGYLPDIHQGQQVSLKGSWGFHAKFGRQFEVKECVAQLPSSVAGIEKYLASGMIKGIGPKFAQRVVAKFGAQTLEIINEEPSRLLEVGGIGQKRIERIILAWQEQKEVARVMVFLREKDVSTAYAVKIFKAYGNQAISKITQNPYRLVEDIWGVGFKTADGIAIKLGIEPDSLERVKAGILHGITAATDMGHLYIEVGKLKEEVAKLLEIELEAATDKIKAALQDLYYEDKVKLISYQDQHYLTLPKYYFSEFGIARKAQKLIERGKQQGPGSFDFEKIYKDIRVADQRGVELNEDQQRGIMTCLQSKVTIITGGPGTGKTTMIKRLIDVLGASKIKFRLAAPTGRAAKRMAESTGCYTETLHRLLEFSPNDMAFTRNEQHALELDYLIIDEASMIDVFLMHSVLKAMPAHASLVLIGDVDQLPSVGAGNVLNDLIKSEKIDVVRLKTVFRQAQDSLIIVNAHRVNKGIFPTSSLPAPKKDFIYIKEDKPENTFAQLRQIYTKKLGRYGISTSNAVVLVPMNRGVVGTTRLNQELQHVLNPEQEGAPHVTQFGQVYRIGDRVMQIRNNYEKFVFNGDMGVINAIDRSEQKLQINFGGRELEYDFAELNELTLSYAISIHKSQGSEFDAVIIPIFMQHFILLQRNLIYTAITRAKKLCILIGQPRAIAVGINNDKGIDRLTFLPQYLTTDLEAR
ncbi:MAG: ATP-dependent RecD-like DNA helicase [Epsilonproteobacteria bacterium]|nr:ATP-dependent RecD-like DNA helicase [Campylobacterota bacterium]